KRLGYKLVSDGTDCHMILVDLRPKKIDGARIDVVLEAANIAANKNATPGDKSALTPYGIRLGTPAMTSRGFGEKEFVRVAEYIDKLVGIAQKVQSELPKEANKLKDFKEKIWAGVPEIEQIRNEV